ncbi:hypothetical protein BCR35DRAFT_95701 [Leucosporidium creatinivorum]|uniref:Uncharacterized protein n=1 Tax=Leucosporidium creatinivorum TaxID=106004 RepID=A0A1Y2F8L7_9BASI|nr:hypothetical protein BCR35DRAFT_95701 [Leucosporidium creatinivorum]
MLQTSTLLRSSLLRSSARPLPLRALALAGGAHPGPHLRSFHSSPFQQETGGVSQQPGSKSFTELGKNAIEETKGIGKVVVGAVTGRGSEAGKSKEGGEGGEGEGKGLGSLKSDLDSVKSLAHEMPRDALMWGGLGLLPYAGTSLATVYLARQASLAVSLGESSGLNSEAAMILLQQVQQLQISYGAVVLSFVGAIHWGFEFSKYAGTHPQRYTLGILPSILGCGSLLLAPQAALMTQWAGFFGAWYADQQATNKGLTPGWYSTYRFWLTTVVGSSILLTLAGESYFGSDGKAMERRNAVLKLGEKGVAAPTGKSADLGDYRITKTDRSSAEEGYTKFTKIDHEAEEKKKEEDRKEMEEEAKKSDAKPTASKEEREENAKRARSQSGLN